MTETKEKEIRATPEAAPETGRLTMKSGNKTLVIGLHFSETSKEKSSSKRTLRTAISKPPSYIFSGREKMS